MNIDWKSTQGKLVIALVTVVVLSIVTIVLFVSVPKPQQIEAIESNPPTPTNVESSIVEENPVSTTENTVVAPTATVPWVVEIPPIQIPTGTYTLGRTTAEIEADILTCVSIMSETGQEEVCNRDNFTDRPERTFELTTTVLMDQYETPDPRTGLPLIVSFETAQKACEDRGGRLPTESELEAAMIGLEGRRWPWVSNNQNPDADLATKANLDVLGGRGANPPTVVWGFGEGKSPEGFYNLVGNVHEWTLEGITKGGGSGTFYILAVPAHMLNAIPEAGFRCVNATTKQLVPLIN